MMNQIGGKICSWTRTKIVDPLFQILQRGAEPKQLAFSAALGITLGVFPICGVTVFLCAIAIALFGSFCNAPTVLLANFIATPIELRFCRRSIGNSLSAPIGAEVRSTYTLPSPDPLCEIFIGLLLLLYFISLVIPFLRLGEFVTGGSHFPLTSDALKKVFTGEASREVLLSIFHALLGWLCAVPFILAGLYVVFLPCFTILVRKFSTGPPSPKMPLIDVNVKARDV